jgi:thiol-disulfide isomerase/thioredoxin
LLPVGKEGGTIDRSHKGSQLPDLAFDDAAGRQLRLGALKGEPILINLWATWCAPCIAELPTLDRLAARGDLKVLTVSQDLQRTEKVAPFLAERGGKRLEPWLDPDNALGSHYAITVLPATVLYDSQGREVWRVLGPLDWSGPEAAELLKEAGS